ncbi:hypothetical protein SAMN05216353_12143 [Halobacillus alkaliphilus]|uniref:Uncharacterized protein n=1 Tax=Halobacillus alkaliphilus TaxID=396056 RepID=A0A1I2NXW0_9BACI|nr:RAxF-45 family protein [Halobacillus alkaliphilus]SFG06336.1 hypothetical protein SAMN05216353_12143 [Halobacillus alkaliphilus]
MLQMHVLDYQLNYVRRAIIHNTAVKGTRLSIFTGE